MSPRSWLWSAPFSRATDIPSSPPNRVPKPCACWTTGEFHGVVSDMRTPGGVDGAQVYAWIAAHRPELASRLVFITGDIANEETAATLRRTGAPCVEKPFRVHDFISVVEQTMGKGVMTQTLQTQNVMKDFRIRLLIVDDEQTIRRLCMTVGESLGFSCLEAESGEAALALLEEQPVHMVLTDMVMPHMSGIEFLEQVKRTSSAHRSRGHDRTRLGRNRRPGHEAGRLRLHCQALCSAR